jgi:hypothetical protein
MRCRSPALAMVLLDHGAGINACSGDGRSSGSTCLKQAVASNDLPVVQLSLSRGAWVGAKMAYCPTYIYMACILGRSAIAEALLAAGASVEKDLLLHTVLRGKYSRCVDAKLELQGVVATWCRRQ